MKLTTIWGLSWVMVIFQLGSFEKVVIINTLHKIGFA